MTSYVYVVSPMAIFLIPIIMALFILLFLILSLLLTIGSNVQKILFFIMVLSLFSEFQRVLDEIGKRIKRFGETGK